MQFIRQTKKSKQQGAVLIISLIVLIIISLLGLSSMESTVLSERMARNYRDDNIAYQAAESALRDAEAWLDAQATAPVPTNNGANRVWSFNSPILSPVIPDTSWWANPNSWWVTNGRAYSGMLTGISAAEQPRSIIEVRTSILGAGGSGSIVIGGGGGGGGAGSIINYYQITARGVAPNGQAQVILQSVYSKGF